MKTYCVAQGTLLSALRWPNVEEIQRKRGYMCNYGWFTLPYRRSWNSGAQQLYFKKKKSNNFTFVKKPLELMVTKREKVMGVRMNWEAGIDIYTLLLLLSRFSRVQLCATPWMTAHQAPPSLGFSRQEHWSGLPFPSSMHESEKWKWSCSVVSNS